MKNRGRTEMLAAMLEVAKGKVTKTKIMYKAYLSYNQLPITRISFCIDRKQSNRIS